MRKSSSSLLSLSDYRFARRETEWQAFSCIFMCVHLFVISLVIFPFRHLFSFFFYIHNGNVRIQLQMYTSRMHSHLGRVQKNVYDDERDDLWLEPVGFFFSFFFHWVMLSNGSMIRKVVRCWWSTVFAV